MRIERLAIPDILLLTPRRFADNRGFFSETYNLRTMAEAGIDAPFVQDNHSLSRQRGVIRGLHCQVAPHPQGKLVRCTRGAIWDVAVDARRDSPHFGRWVAAELNAENGSQIWIPPGFLHGFCTLTENTEVQYKCTDLWDGDCERAVRWNSPDLAIAWPAAPGEAVLSDKDAMAPDFSIVRDWF
jgi:dTDP-4-dehydrorhamnose 3,5-epimerase